MIKYLKNKEEFEKEIKKTILIDFYADWCGPCKMLGQVLEEIDEIDILKVNVDEYPEIATKYGVMSIPTLIYIENGKEKTKNIGFIPKEEIIKMTK